MSTAKSKPWGAFLYSDYPVLWVILVMGSILSWMRILGTAQWLLDETGSAYLVGLIGVVQLVVQVPVTLWAGNLADRMDRKKLMSYAYGTTTLVMTVLGVLEFQDALTPVFVYLGIAVMAGTHMLASPARAAIVPIVVPKSDLMLAVSTDTASSNAAAIAGPLLFAFVAVNFGSTEVFLIAAIIGSVAALLPLFVKAAGIAEGHDHSEVKPSQIQQTKAGFSYVSKHPILPGLFLLDIGITTASFYREILPVLALGLFAGGASATGMLGAANSTGAILGSFVALLFVTYKAKGMLVLYASFAYGFILFGFGLANSLWMGLLMIGLLGAADAVTVAVRATTVMLTTPDHMRGRAYALMILAAQTANNIGTIWVGAWAGAIGANNTMLLGGVISITATAMIWWFWKPIREFRSD
ncbi:MFS transporter [Pseudomonadales bacterium]|nr:MFS transporter [Pseudomonadales bacterium]